jgi:hypothetical protein
MRSSATNAEKVEAIFSPPSPNKTHLLLPQPHLPGNERFVAKQKSAIRPPIQELLGPTDTPSQLNILFQYHPIHEQCIDSRAIPSCVISLTPWSSSVARYEGANTAEDEDPSIHDVGAESGDPVPFFSSPLFFGAYHCLSPLEYVTTHSQRECSGLSYYHYPYIIYSG